MTWADVVAVAPELAATPSASQTALLAYATAQCPVEAWGALQPQGIVYLAAHMGTLARTRGGGMVTQESIDRLSRSYMTPVGLKSSLALSSYGAEYGRLVRLLPVSIGGVY